MTTRLTLNDGKILEHLYVEKNMSAAAVAKELGMTVSAVRRRLYHFCLTKDKRTSQAESGKETQQNDDSNVKKSIFFKLREDNKRSNKRWSKEEEERLKILFIDQKMTSKAIAEQTGRTLASIENRLYRLNLKKEERMSWIKEEDDFLRMNYRRFRVDYMSERLGRSRQSVRNRIKALNLRLRGE